MKLKVVSKKNFWLYIVLGALLVLASVVLCPLWIDVDVFWSSWGKSIVSAIIGALILVYVFGYLLKKVTARGNGAIKVLTIIEFALLLLIALGCFLSQFNVLPISGACTILGLALWCRGVVELFRAYYFQRGSTVKYPLWLLVVAIAMVSAGMYFMVSSVFSDIQVLWVFVAFMLVVGIVLIVYGAMCAPKKHKK